MALEVWVKGYRQASPFLTSPPTGWADGLKLPQLVVRTSSPEGRVQNGNVRRERQHVQSFPRSAGAGLRGPTEQLCAPLPDFMFTSHRQLGIRQRCL